MSLAAALAVVGDVIVRSSHSTALHASRQVPHMISNGFTMIAITSIKVDPDSRSCARDNFVVHHTDKACV